MPSILLDPSAAARLPTPLAVTIATLANETREHGEHTTADELANCVEAFFGLVGRVWIAEYLAAGAPDPAANALLYGRFVLAYKDPLLGAWIATGRSLRAVFLERGLVPVARGLLDLDFGEFGDNEHPVAKLSAYRNSFAHGTFHAVVDDIVHHRALLEGLIARLPFLVEQPILVDDGTTVLALRATAESASRPSAPLVRHHPTLVGDDGRAVDLYPLALGKDETGTAALAWTSIEKGKKGKGPSPCNLVDHDRFAIWAERYQRELDGDVESAPACLGEAIAAPELRAKLEAAIAGVEDHGRCLVLVESPPGAPRRGLLAHGAAGDALRWRVEPGELMGSGLVLVKAIARHAERRLSLPRGTIALKEASAWRNALADVAQRCEGAGVRLRIAIEELHLGDAPARSGEPSVQEVWRRLASGPWTVLGGATRAWSLRPLPWDARVELGWDAGVDRASVAGFLRDRATGPLHREVLAALLESEGACDLFSLCDTLERGSGEADANAGSVFEPAVERALWELAPVLALSREGRTHDGVTEEARTFAPLDRALVRAALTEAP